MTVSDEDLKYLVENDYYDIPIHKDKDVEFIDVADIARELLERRERDRWIPVSERLPNPNISCLVRYMYSIGHNNFMSSWISHGFIDYYTNMWVVDSQTEISRFYVTHWRPLPEPPEAD